MRRRIAYTSDALADPADIKRWLTQPGSSQTARRRLASIWADIERLRDQPCLWPVGQHTGVRELPCTDGHRVLYEVSADTGSNETAGDVLVLRVCRPGQDRTRF